MLIKRIISVKKSHTTIENNSEILDSNNAAPAKNAIFPKNNWAIIAINVRGPPSNPFFIFFFRPSEIKRGKKFGLTSELLTEFLRA